MEYLSLLMLAPLSILTVTDFRHREVSLTWLGVLLASTVCVPLLQDGWTEVIKRSGENLITILYLSTGTLLWSWVKARRIMNPINVYVGLGDLLFFIILIPVFPFKQYTYLLIGCMVFSLIWWWTVLLLKRKPKNIPLIATSSIIVGIAIILKVFLR